MNFGGCAVCFSKLQTIVPKDHALILGFSAAMISFRRHCVTGSNFRSVFPIPKGWYSPVFLTNVDDPSNPFGPKTLISQLSFWRELTIAPAQSPADRSERRRLASPKVA